MRITRFGRALVFAAMLCALAGCTILDNFHTVEPDKFYRSGQMEPQALRHTLKRYNIKTVVNLRGVNPDESWYRDEIAVCAGVGVTHHDLPWSKNRLPEPESLAQFVELYETAERPILVHCQGGTHRSGTASACYVLLSGGTVEEARKQFGIFFGDAYIGTLLDLYEGSGVGFAEWCRTIYPTVYATVPPSGPGTDEVSD